MLVSRKPKQTSGGRAVLVGVVVPALVTVVAVLGISALRSNSDERRRGQILLARIDAAANRQGQLASTVSSLAIVVQEGDNPAFERDLDALPREIITLGGRIERDLAALATLSPPEQELGSVDATLAAFEKSLNTEIAILEDREFDDAWIFHRERVAPAYAALHARIEAADDAYSELAASSNQIANFGTIAVVFFAVAVLAFLQFDRSRRTRVLMETEQRVIRDSEARFRSLIQRSSDVISITGDDLIARYHSPAIENLLGVSPEDATGKSFTDFVHPEDVALVRSLHQEVMEEPDATPALECRFRHSDGSLRDVEITATNALDVPNVAGLVFNTRDITERKEAERERGVLEGQLAHQAYHDPLTGLANRVLFKDRVDHALSRRSRGAEELAVLFLDLDNFKSVNDTLGHEAGDELLKRVADRLVTCLRDSDTIARLGGDEFAVLIEGVNGDQDAYVVADRLIESLQMPFDLKGRHVLCGGSVGVAFSTEGSSSEELLANADVAMYAAKAAGKARRETYRADMRKSLITRMSMEAELQRAVENQEFVIHYQPIFSVGTERITGVEALVRWAHPERGIIPPGDFIPLAEETGLIVPIGKWVLEQACLQAKLWQEHYTNGSPLKVSVNLSVRQFQQTNLVGEVAEVLRTSQLPPHALTLEITESILVQDNLVAVDKLQELKELGVQLALDDFGTGYSSLGYLRRFPIDVLKIDKSFIDGLTHDSEEAALARAIVQIGETLRLCTVAEGIEHEEQATELRNLGCEEGQGYYYARPLEASAVTALLEDSKIRA